jgi:hypothetical protein
MASWSAIEAEVPELAALARTYLDASVHKTIATLRRDGSPRISGNEVRIAQGELWLGCMWRSLKALDLLRDPRLALHSTSLDPPAWKGDAKLAGRAEEVDDDALKEAVYGHVPGGPYHLFRVEVDELVVVRLPDDDPPEHLIIESWHAGRGVTRLER